MKEENELLKKLEYLYLLLENELAMGAFNIQFESGIDKNIWIRLVTIGYIKLISVGNKPVYKWVGKVPDIKLAIEIQKDYSELVNEKMNLNDLPLQKAMLSTKPILEKKENLSDNVSIKNLVKKDTLINWAVPIRIKRGEFDFKINFKSNTLTITDQFLYNNFPNLEIGEINVAFVFDEERVSIVINPKLGIPFYKFIGYNGKAKKRFYSPSIGSVQLTNLMLKRFRDVLKIPKSYDVGAKYLYGFDLIPYTVLSGMQFYELVIPLE
jgi:hypothetical protein